MVDTVVHQLTQSLSPSTSLKEIKLGGNGVANDPLSMSSWEYVSMSEWDHLSTMDLPGNVLSPNELDLLLRASPGSLNKLHVTCQVDHVTSARPDRECWPCTTISCMIVATVPNLHEVLCSLSAGVWPVTTLELVVPEGQHHEMSVEEASGHWPRLRKLNLRSNVIHDLFVSLLVDGNWPLLKSVDLYDNEIGEEGVQQLCNANWPHLAKLDLGDNDLTGRGMVTEMFHGLLCRTVCFLSWMLGGLASLLICI